MQKSYRDNHKIQQGVRQDPRTIVHARTDATDNARIGEYTDCDYNGNAPQTYDTNNNVEIRVSKAPPPRIAANSGEYERTENKGREPYVEQGAPRKSTLTMRLSDVGLHQRQTKALYPNHRLPPWLTEDATRDRSNRLLELMRKDK
jgi:hypothetical protein